MLLSEMFTKRKAIRMKELKNYYGNSLNYEYINFSDYFRTLSSEGKRQSFLTEKKFVDIKKQIGGILSELIAEYTGYESTSVMKETANDIFVSLLYCLDMALFTFESHEDALDFITENDVKTVYLKGQKVIKQCVLECVSLLVKAKKCRINYPHTRYNKMLDGEIIAYMKRYDSKYFAHGMSRFFSYSSVNGCGGYRGILHLKKHLENLIFENCFVNGFGEEIVQNLIYGYCEKNDIAYNEIESNIYSIVVMNRIFAEMSGKEGIEVLKEDALRISKLLKKLPENEQRRVLIDTAEKTFNDSYIQKSSIRLAGHEVNALKNNDLNKIIYIGDLR